MGVGGGFGPSTEVSMQGSGANPAIGGEGGGVKKVQKVPIAGASSILV